MLQVGVGTVKSNFFRIKNQVLYRTKTKRRIGSASRINSSSENLLITGLQV